MWPTSQEIFNEEILNKNLHFSAVRFILELKERLFIKRDKPIPNKNHFSQELLLF